MEFSNFDYRCLNSYSFYISIRPDQFNFWEHRFFSKFEGSVGQKKKENKKKSPIFCIGFDYQ